MNEDTVRIATRKSALALWQAEEVAERLRKAHPGLRTELVRMSTQGDRVLDSPLAKLGGKGLFVKELEQGLLADIADIAVHSMKDVPVEIPDGLTVPVILAREDPRDAFVSTAARSLDSLPVGARLGTSSLRRQCQLHAAFPHLVIEDLRGNVNTRLAKLDAGEYAAIILAAAGLKRLGMEARITRCLTVEQSLPAIGQGAIGIECRAGDERILSLISPLHDEPTAICIEAERAVNARLAGGCQVPLAGYAELQGDEIHLRALVGFPNGSEVYCAEARGPVGEAEAIGLHVAEELRAKGAGGVLEQLGIAHNANG
ncbi:MAG: hydroxymethylbilane synthase [Gammaproteobacteria bacterium]|jgi:hydroxymethylbilane synthase|nr:hydroxymethylbilane synthase [Gammaproteobacteria bacterium]